MKTKLLWLGIVSILGVGCGGNGPLGGGGGFSPDPSLVILSPNAGAVLSPGPVAIRFQTFNFEIGDQGEPHLQFFIDNDPVANHFFNGATQEVLKNGVHTHQVHWISENSIEIYALAAGDHQVFFQLVDENDAPLSLPSAAILFHFELQDSGNDFVTLVPVKTNLAGPVTMAFAPDGRLFYNELGDGRTMVLDSSDWSASPAEFCQFSVGGGGERGLLGLALDPDFSNNGFVYVFYTAADLSENIVERVTDTKGACTASTELIRLPSASIHNGGNLHFGPDAQLYVTLGDTSNSDFAQDLSAIAGKMLRLNGDGSIPLDNPFVGVNGAREEVFAYGLRNSFDFCFHPLTDDLWATENGPNSNDEINRILAGENFGWPLFGGFANTPGFTDPLVTYNPTIAPTGIVAVEPNSVYPAEYDDNLIFVDYNNGRIYRLILDSGNFDHLIGQEVIFSGGVGGLLDIVQGPDGYLYVTSFDTLYRIDPL